MEGQGVKASNISLDGRPYGHEIEKIIEWTLGTENDIPEISDWLSEKLKAFENAVERGDKGGIQGIWRSSRRRAVLTSILRLWVQEFAEAP